MTAVAPYVPTAAIAFLPSDVQRHEPLLALDGGDDGLDLVGRIVRSAGELARPGGHLLLEVGPATTWPWPRRWPATGSTRSTPGATTMAICGACRPGDPTSDPQPRPRARVVVLVHVVGRRRTSLPVRDEVDYVGAAFEAVADPGERLAERRGHEPEVVAASARLLVHVHPRASGGGGEGDGVVGSTVRSARPEPAGQVRIGRRRQQLSGIVGPVPVLRPPGRGRSRCGGGRRRRTGVTGEVDEGGVQVVVAQGEGQRTRTPLGVAGHPHAAAIRRHREVGSHVGGDIDGQIRLRVPPGAVDALGVTEGRPLASTIRRRGPRLHGRRRPGRPRGRGGRSGSSRRSSPGCPDEHHDRPRAIGSPRNAGATTAAPLAWNPEAVPGR